MNFHSWFNERCRLALCKRAGNQNETKEVWLRSRFPVLGSVTWNAVGKKALFVESSVRLVADYYFFLNIYNSFFFFVSGLVTLQFHSGSAHTRAHWIHVHTQLSVSLFWWGWRAGTLIDRRWVSGWKADNYIFNRIFKGQTYNSVIGIFTRQLKGHSAERKEKMKT